METFTYRHAVEKFKHYSADQTGYVSDDSPFSDKEIVQSLNEIRSTEVRTFLAQGVEISETMVQTLGCVNVIEVDRSECACAPASGCYWLKATTVLPKYLKVISVTGLVANGDNPRFTFIKWDRFQWIPESRNSTMRNGLYWTVKDTGDGPHIYLYGNRFLKAISISAIWENPIEAAAFPSCGKENIEAICNPLDVPFYTDLVMVDTIVPKAWQKLLPVKASAGVDAMNDDKSSAVRKAMFEAARNYGR